MDDGLEGMGVLVGGGLGVGGEFDFDEGGSGREIG